MVDLGLATGIKDLWQENLLRDYTLVVEGQEFQVHKVVLAAVSKYFKAMLGEGYMESKTDRVEVKGFSAEIVSKLLEFLYTANENVIGSDALGILQCAMYLQMPSIADFCVKKMMRNIDFQDCLEILSSMIEYSFNEEVKELKDFIESNWGKVQENYNPEGVSYESLQVLLQFWERSEWDKFLCIKNWICSDWENHIGFVHELMCEVRFCVISQQEIESIVLMDIYCKSEPPTTEGCKGEPPKTERTWRDLVVNAMKYHQLPIHLKVVDKSEQSELKTQPVLTVFSAKRPTQEPVQLTVNMFALSEENKWVKQEHSGLKLNKSPETICLEVNNFLIVCRTYQDCQMYETNQDWQIFDPRTSTWSMMPSMDRPKRYFALAHHNDILYTVGGRYLPNKPSREMEQYSFLTNKWSCVHQLPVPLRHSAACVLGGTIYVSFGFIDSGDDYSRLSDDLYRLDLSADSAEWETKAPSLWEVGGHQMSVLRRNDEEGLFIIDLDLGIQFYSPSLDQWTEIINGLDLGSNDTWLDHGLLVIKGNVLFLLNRYQFVPPDGDGERNSYISWKVTIPEKAGKITIVDLEEFPQLPYRAETFGAVLAIPPL